MIEDNVLKGKIDFNDKFSEESKEAIKKILNPNPSKRPKAK